MRTCNRCGGAVVDGKIHHQHNCIYGQVENAEADASRRLGLLSEAKDWLEAYLEYLDNDIPTTVGS